MSLLWQRDEALGNKLLLIEVSRQSKKAAEEAERIAEEKADWFLNQVVTRYGLTLADSKES